MNVLLNFFHGNRPLRICYTHMKESVILMDGPFIKAHIRQFLRRKLHRISDEYLGKDLSRSAVIFSPHFDDETLGCGGTILKKKRAEADIKIVFMTDGSKSHRHLISEETLKEIRANEALAAGRSLGLDTSDVFFLDFEETKLNEHINSAIERVKEILLSQKFDEIFIPYNKEPLLWSEDHLATNRIVVSALRMLGINTVIYEYPIWFWCYWPWANTPINNLKELMHTIKMNLVSNIFLLRDLRCSVYIGDVLELKRAALDQYKSQMTRLIPDPSWSTLSDVSNGEFLECFFIDREFFHKYHFTAR